MGVWEVPLHSVWTSIALCKYDFHLMPILWDNRFRAFYKILQFWLVCDPQFPDFCGKLSGEFPKGFYRRWYHTCRAIDMQTVVELHLCTTWCHYKRTSCRRAVVVVHPRMDCRVLWTIITFIILFYKCLFVLFHLIHIIYPDSASDTVTLNQLVIYNIDLPTQLWKLFISLMVS